MPSYILAIDQGTTSSRAILYNQNLEVVSSGQKPFPQYFPKAGWVEHDSEEIWASVKDAVKEALSKVNVSGFDASQIAGIGITNQRETFALWERKTGQPCGRAIVWQCRRSAAICESLRKKSQGKSLAKLTGLVIDPYFSGTKLKWWLATSKNLMASARRGDLAFGTIDTFLIWRLSAGRSHVTDVSNASRTLLMDLKKRQWSPEALKTLGIPQALLPKILDSDADFGSTQGLDFLPDGIPIRGVLGDQQAALFGQACLSAGTAKITYGTGAFFLINTGAKLRRTKFGVSTVAWTLKGKTSFALEGSVFIAGAAVQWLRDGLKTIEKSSDIEPLAASVADSGGVFFIPALSGLGAPDWEPSARGLIGGLSRGSTRAHLARACLEGITQSVADAFDGLRTDSRTPLKKVKVDGGASANQILLQSQADLLQTLIERPHDLESTARGAASMAAISLGIVAISELEKKNPIVKTVRAKISKAESKKLRLLWRRRVRALVSGAY